MADNLQRSFESLSMGRTNHSDSFSSANAPSYRSSSSSMHAAPFGQTFPGSHAFGNGAGTGDLQSASARFERFFNPTTSSGGSSSHGADASNSSGHSPFKQQSAAPGSLGSSSMAAGLASGGAFGSFGHAYQPSQHQQQQNQVNSGGSGVFSSSAGVPALHSKSSGMRQGIPPQWGGSSHDDQPIGSSTSPTHSFITPHSTFLPPPSGTAAFGGSASNPMGSMGGSPMPSGSGQAPSDDDIIPTAIVVKNIPFSVKREQLLQVIEELHIPMPYAFNYHFDQGVFRGLAFANFRSGEEADAVVAAFNGFDVAGRKLRVEYKKVLQAGEKERIEKEKAIKRMQSMQMEKERARRQTVTNGLGEDWSTHFGSMGASGQPAPAFPSTLQQNSSKVPGLELDSGYGDASGEVVGALTPENLRALPDSQTDLAAGAASELSGRREELDLNDPATLEIYSRVLLFKDDRMRDELSFSKNLTTVERRIVHMVSKKLNLYHYSSGEGDDRHVTVTKNEVSAQRPLRTQASTIGRSNRGESNAVGVNGLLGPGSSHTTGRSGLRMKKSAPDMKRPRERSEESGAFPSSVYVFGQGGANNTTIGGGNAATGGAGFANGGLSRKSNGNLREGYSASMGRRPTVPSGAMGGAAGLQSLFSSPFDVPPVPALPGQMASHAAGGVEASTPRSASHSPSPTPIGGERGMGAGGPQSNSGSLSAASAQYILRQPAGPGSVRNNFAQRSRVPLSSAQAATTGIGAGTPLAAHAGGSGSGAGAGADAGDGGRSSEDQLATRSSLRDNDLRSHEPLEV